MSIRHEILNLVETISRRRGRQPFRPARPVPVSGRVFDADDVKHLVDAVARLLAHPGRYGEPFEREFARSSALRHALLVNSGSSANLVALTALTRPQLGDKPLQPGDEVITVAAGFPTTVNPIIQNGCVPVFVDVRTADLQRRRDATEAALSDRTRAVMIAHTLGNPFDLDAVPTFCAKTRSLAGRRLLRALGADLPRAEGRHLRRPGDDQLLPAHHITMGEGGAVLTDSPCSRRSPNRSATGAATAGATRASDNTCGKRFDWQLGDLPHGYDHKYIYSHIGYNLKVTDMQAAIGVSQMRKLPASSRPAAPTSPSAGGPGAVGRFLLLPEPTPNSNPSWFGFPITVRDEAPSAAINSSGVWTPARSGRAFSSAATCCVSPPIRRRSPRRRRPRQRGSRHEPDILDRRLSGHHASHDGFRDSDDPRDAGRRRAENVGLTRPPRESHDC